MHTRLAGTPGIHDGPCDASWIQPVVFDSIWRTRMAEILPMETCELVVFGATRENVKV